MDFMLLIIEPRGQREARTEAQAQEAYASMLRFADGLKDRGVLRSFASLQGDATAQRVQLRESGARLLDGPFAETKEMIGGFFVVDAASRDDAVAIAQTCPAAGWATVEVRPMGPCFL